MEFSEKEVTQNEILLNHILFGLRADDLISNEFTVAVDSTINQEYPEVHGPGIVLGITVPGVELFLWAFGYSDKAPAYYLDRQFSPIIDGAPSVLLMSNT
jgi:hypothetical protein